MQRKTVCPFYGDFDAISLRLPHQMFILILSYGPLSKQTEDGKSVMFLQYFVKLIKKRICSKKVSRTQVEGLNK